MTFFCQFSLPTGLLTALQTDESHLRSGYGSLILKHISKLIAETGHDIYAGVDESNQVSRKFFEKLGFKAIENVYFTATKHNWCETDE